MEATEVSINRWMDKEDVAYIYNGILLSHKKERNWVICSEVDGLRDCHTEWSKSEKEKQIPYANMHIWNLKKKRYWWTLWQGRNKDADGENGLEDIGGEGEGGTKWESSTDIYTLPNVKWWLVGSCCIAQGDQLDALWRPRGWDREGGADMGIYVYV